MLTHGSLFSGIGGFDLGFERAGIKTVWQVENDPYAAAVLSKHWPEVTRYTDIKKVEWENVEVPDIVSGGFPCQPVSVAGKRKGQEDERWLWPEFARCLRILRPRYTVLENVPGLLALGFGDVLGDLAALGYDAEWDSIPAAAFGAPHLRYRVWIVAYADGSGRKGRAGMFGTGRRGKPENGGQRIFPNTFSSKRFKGREQQRTSSLSVSEYWTTEPDVGRVAYGIPSRVDRLKCLGNAVVPQITEWIGRRIVEFDKEP